MTMKHLIISILCLMFLAGNFSSPIFGQDDVTLTDEGEEITQEDPPSMDEDEDSDEKYVMWADPLYYQFEKMMPELASSIGRLDTRISTLAVTGISFGPGLDESFKKVAEAKLFGQLLLENPRLKLIKCDECNQIRSEVKNGILTISKGLADQEERKNLANKLGVQGFMTTMITVEDRQLTIVINVHDSQEGRIILSDVIPGVPVAKTKYYHLYIGQLTIPVSVVSETGVSKNVDQTAIIVGLEQTIRFSESWMVGANLALFYDNNSTLGESGTDYVPFTTGLLFDGTIAWEAFSMMNNSTSLIVQAGLGEFISAQFNFSVYYKFGAKMTMGSENKLTFNMGLLSFNESNLEKPDTTTGKASALKGSATYITFGYQF
jgi:hypothetical protein